METKIVQFVRQRNCQVIAKDKAVRLRYVVREQGSEQALAFRDASRAELDAGYAFGLSG